ncbi:relaxase/mobilization nuclease domain-containing protein [Celeribacter sp.]|uniref:relaxase/mobilization nuclease domain-containing protein n=1 Tax=Celeribacter sp. TaxID=1890673 RepID=UPI003A9503EA
MNERDNDHVDLLDIRGFMADDLHGALSEAHAISKATRCTQFMFSLSLNPPPDHIATEQDFLDAAQRVEKRLDLSDQPRAIVIHEKEGRRHAHVVWSRIDADSMTAINLPHFKLKLCDLSKELYLDHGWELPKGLQTHGGKSPLNFTLEEWQQAKRIGVDPREIKQVFQQAWERSDSQIGFKNALEERGYFLAKGDRRGFVALDVEGNVFAIPKWTSLKTKEVKTKLGDPEALPSVDDTRATIRSKVSEQMRGFIARTKARHRDEAKPLIEEKSDLVAQHRDERHKLAQGQKARWLDETKTRNDRLNKGLRGLFDRFSGKAKSTRQHNEAEALAAFKRDQAQKQALIEAQMRERKTLQKRMIKLRDKQKQERVILARNVAGTLKMKSNVERRPRRRSRDIGLSPS